MHNRYVLSGTRRIVVASFVAGFATFCIVQDRVTFYGTVRYEELQRTAAAAHSRAATIDEVMPPVVAKSVRLGFIWGGIVSASGLAFAAWRRRR